MNDFNCLMQSSQIDGGGLDWDLGMILSGGGFGSRRHHKWRWVWLCHWEDETLAHDTINCYFFLI
jgi:hypothetical protein